MGISKFHAQQLFDKAKEAMAEMKAELKEAKGTAASLFPDKQYDANDPKQMQELKERYQAGLKVHVIDDPSSPEAKALMKKMYKLYATVFPLPSEREEYDKLMELMGKNHDKQLQASGAPFKEQWVLLENEKGEIVGARNVITFSGKKEKDLAASADGTQHLIYGFVDPRFRSLGLGDYTMGIAEEEARKFIAEKAGKPKDKVDFIQISEQNAPLQMSAQDILKDTAGAKTDQFWRRAYYENLGFRELKFDYVQLPLEPRENGGEPCEGLNLIVRGVPGEKSDRGMQRVLTEMPSSVARFHLYNFFDRSVAAGQYDIETDPDWQRQVANLNTPTLGVQPKLDFMKLQGQTWQHMQEAVNAGQFKAGEFANATVGELMGVSAIPAAADPSMQATAKASSNFMRRPSA